MDVNILFHHQWYDQMDAGKDKENPFENVIMSKGSLGQWIRRLMRLEEVFLLVIA